MHRNLHFLASAAIIAAVFGGNVPGANRLASLGKTGRLFSFTHISKTGGASFVHWATRSSGKENFAEFFPVLAAGVEEGFLFDRKQHPNAIHLTLLRDPRSHVLSLYKECRFGTWGMKVWAQAIEEQQPWASGTQLEGLDAFVSFYQEPGGKEWLNCYEPWNFQGLPHNHAHPARSTVSLHHSLRQLNCSASPDLSIAQINHAQVQRK